MVRNAVQIITDRRNPFEGREGGGEDMGCNGRNEECGGVGLFFLTGVTDEK